MGSKDNVFVMGMSPERAWQISRTIEVQKEVQPKSVLEVGFPRMRESILDIWTDALVETVDPYVPQATHVVMMENFKPQRRYDLVHMGSVLDYFADPIRALRVATECSDYLLLTGRLNTYTHHTFRCAFLVPTVGWVETRLRPMMGMEDAEPRYFGSQMFSINGKMKWVGYD